MSLSRKINFLLKLSAVSCQWVCRAMFPDASNAANLCLCARDNLGFWKHCKLPSSVCFPEKWVGGQCSGTPDAHGTLEPIGAVLHVPCTSCGNFCWTLPLAELTELRLFALSWTQWLKKTVKIFLGIADRLLLCLCILFDSVMQSLTAFPPLPLQWRFSSWLPVPSSLLTDTGQWVR